MRGILEMFFKQYNAVLSAEWKFTMNRTNGIARGGCASSSPKHVRTLANLPDFAFNNGFTIQVTKPRYIQLSYFTTIALYVGNNVQSTEKAYAWELDNLIAQYNKENREKAYTSTVRQTLNNKFILADPSNPYLARYITNWPCLNGFFYRLVYNLNELGTNFLKTNLKEKHVQSHVRHNSKGQTEALTARLNDMEQKTNKKITNLQHGTAIGFSMMLQAKSTDTLEVEACQLMRAIAKISDRIETYKTTEERQGLLNNLNIVNKEIESIKEEKKIATSIAARPLLAAGFTISAPPQPRAGKTPSS